MKISGYTWAANVKGKLLPYEASIRSMLLLADEVWVAFDPRYDTAETFTEIDPRVNVIAHPFYIERITGAGDQLTQARTHCDGDWLIWLDLDEVIHERDVQAINDLIFYADSAAFNAISISSYSYFMYEYTFKKAVLWGLRAKFLKNIPAVTHGVIEDGLRERADRTQYMTNGDGIDFVQDGHAFPHRVMTFRDYPFLAKLGRGMGTDADVLRTVEQFPHIYHYSRYSIQRKMKMQTHQSAAYFQGQTDDYQPDVWADTLGKAVELTPERESPGDDGSILGPVNVPHPQTAVEWVELIDEMTGRK
jgi:hypothetical protein